MGQIVIDGFGVVEIEGDTPTKAEQAAILKAIGEAPPDMPVPKQPREGPLGLVPAEARETVRSTIEEQPGLVQLAAEVGPSLGGAIGGAALGAPLGPLGMLAGGVAGGVLGEAAAQESGVAPESQLNLGLAAAGPIAGPVAGQALRLGGRAVGRGVTRFPFVGAARSRTATAEAASEFESLGTRIFGKQKGLMARPASDLYAAVDRAGVRIAPSQLSGTTQAIADLQAEMAPLSAFPVVRQSMRALNNLATTILENPAGATMQEVVRARQLLGAIVGQAESAGGIKFGAAKKAFAALSDDLDRIAAGPGLGSRAARLAKAATQRAKLQFAVGDLEAGAARFMQETADGVVINAQGLQKWLRAKVNPKSAQFDKNFRDALEDEIPAIHDRLSELIKIGAAGSPAGPGSIVVRAQGARMGRAVAGSILGAAAGGPVGAGMGAVAGASIPEMLTAALMTKPGSALLKGAARMGQGSISTRAWIALGEFLTRSAGEQSETPQEGENG